MREDILQANGEDYALGVCPWGSTTIADIVGGNGWKKRREYELFTLPPSKVSGVSGNVGCSRADGRTDRRQRRVLENEIFPNARASIGVALCGPNYF